MGVLAICMILAPLSPWLAIAVLAYGAMGSARGISSVAMNTSIMEQVPQHFMGRVQNIFYFAGTALQMVVGFLVGTVAQYNLVAGFSIIGLVYVAAFVSANWPAGAATPLPERAET
jgi:MFS family permease